MEVKKGNSNLFTLAQQASSTEAKATEVKKALITDVAVDVAAPKASADTVKSVKAESQLSASAQQAKLSNQLDQKLKTDFAQKKTNNPVLQNETAQQGGAVRGGGRKVEVEALPFFPYFKFVYTDWNDLKKTHNIPRTLSTGGGDDKVDIQMGSDGRVHVKVNDKETWSGTPEQFKSLTIDTGGGKDVVTNRVDGAYILTGDGVDTVDNTASGTHIDTGAGGDTDYVFSRGSSNEILTGGGVDHVHSTGDGNIINTGSSVDHVFSSGDRNTIRTEDGNDVVSTTGEHNKIWTGEGTDEVVGSGDHNFISTGIDKDTIEFAGHDNDVFAGDGYDDIDMQGNRNRIHGQDGWDTIRLKGDANAIDGGEGNDTITVIGNQNREIKGGAGDDTISVTGHENKIYGGDDVDRVRVDGDNNTIDLGAGRETHLIDILVDPSVRGTGNTYEGSVEDEIEERTLPIKDLLK